MNRKQRRAAEKVRQRVATTKSRTKATSGALHGKMPGVNTRGKTIGLFMIVKNESKVILRCLESVRPIVDYILIEDTGSTDGTQAIIREWLERVGLPGEVYDEPWRDFAYNRSHALAKLRENKDIDYALMIDADDQFIVDAGFDVIAFKESLLKELYNVEMRSGAVSYRMHSGHCPTLVLNGSVANDP
jgi:glycosyltransferase involved in cell wall biosynthesis